MPPEDPPRFGLSAEPLPPNGLRPRRERRTCLVSAERRFRSPPLTIRSCSPGNTPTGTATLMGNLVKNPAAERCAATVSVPPVQRQRHFLGGCPATGSTNCDGTRRSTTLLSKVPGKPEYWGNQRISETKISMSSRLVISLDPSIAWLTAERSHS